MLLTMNYIGQKLNMVSYIETYITIKITNKIITCGNSIVQSVIIYYIIIYYNKKY